MSENEQKQCILIVDDMPDNVHVLGGVLKSDYEIKVALNGENALKIAMSDAKPDMILLDIMMPEMDGYEVCRRLKSDPITSNIPVIFVTAKNEEADEQKGLELGAVDYITKPISPAIVLSRVRTHLALYDQSLELCRQVDERTEELSHTRLQIIQRLGRAAEYRDNETGMHVIRMSHYSRLIARDYSDNEAWVQMVFNAAPMHDVGKIGIPDNILLKPGKLTSEEFEFMQKHSEFGAELLGNDMSELMQMSHTIALTHHERWDGSGYPNGISRENIPLEGRIVAIADVFDALTSERPYKKAWSVEDAVKTIDTDRGTHFDSHLVDHFHNVLPEILKIKARYSD